jgi:acyl-coenzyme A synthetase/AMP-(fatty) acid ligase
VRQRTFAELNADVAQLAAAMKAIGIQKGDRVVGKKIVLMF